MRSVFVALVTLCAMVASANAAVYSIDPTEGATVQNPGGCNLLCAKFTYSPVYTFMPGDIVDFGVLTLTPIYGIYHSFVIKFPAFLNLLSTNFDSAQPYINTIVCSLTDPDCVQQLPPLQAVTYDLSNTVISNTSQIQLVWTGDLVASVPEISTWAMMIVGILGIGLAAVRRRHHPTKNLAPVAR